MNTLEQQLMRDIAEVTGGVVVTDSDLRVAREAVAERVEDRKQRDRRTLLAAAAAGLILIAGVAFALRDGALTSAPPADLAPSESNEQVDAFLVGKTPTAADLDGFWRLDNEGTMVRFTAPDAISFDTAGEILGNPGVYGTYELSGDLITVSVEGGAAQCGGQVFAMRASVPEPGFLRLAYTEPGEGNCATAQDEQWVLEQVLPTGPAMGGVVLSNERGFEPVEDPEQYHGFWMAEGGGFGFEIDSTGDYYVVNDDAVVVDRGSWSADGSQLTLTSSAESEVCVDGDRLVLGSAEQVNPATRVMRTTVEENTCNAAWASVPWILVPDER